MNCEAAIGLLTAMVNDVRSSRLFGKGGPLGWFALTKTLAAAMIRGTLSDRQIELIEHVHADFLKLKRASGQFLQDPECRELVSVLQRAQRRKPKAVTSAERSRNMRLSEVIHALTDGGVVHVGHFEDAERLVGEIAVDERVEIWKAIHAARLAYLCALYQPSK